MDPGRPAAVRATGPRRVQRGGAAGRNGGGSGDGSGSRFSSTPTLLLASEGRNRQRRGGSRRASPRGSPRGRRGAAPGGTREPGGEVAGRPGGSIHDRQSFGRGTGEPAAHRSSSTELSTDPGAASGGGQNRHCHRKRRCVLRPTGVAGAGRASPGDRRRERHPPTGADSCSVRCAHHSRHREGGSQGGGAGSAEPAGRPVGEEEQPDGMTRHRAGTYPRGASRGGRLLFTAGNRE